jgi:hypothetical protein
MGAACSFQEQSTSVTIPPPIFSPIGKVNLVVASAPSSPLAHAISAIVVSNPSSRSVHLSPTTTFLASPRSHTLAPSSVLLLSSKGITVTPKQRFSFALAAQHELEASISGQGCEDSSTHEISDNLGISQSHARVEQQLSQQWTHHSTHHDRTILRTLQRIQSNSALVFGPKKHTRYAPNISRPSIY